MSQKKTHLLLRSSKIVGRLARSGRPLPKTGVTTVIGGEDGVLKTIRVAQLEGKLAVLALVGCRAVGPALGDVLVKAERQERLVVGKCRSNAASWATCAGIVQALDRNVLAFGDELRLGLGRWGSSGKAHKSSKKNGSAAHFEVGFKEVRVGLGDGDVRMKY